MDEFKIPLNDISQNITGYAIVDEVDYQELIGGNCITIA